MHRYRLSGARWRRNYAILASTIIIGPLGADVDSLVVDGRTMCASVDKVSVNWGRLYNYNKCILHGSVQGFVFAQGLYRALHQWQCYCVTNVNCQPRCHVDTMQLIDYESEPGLFMDNGVCMDTDWIIEIKIIRIHG